MYVIKQVDCDSKDFMAIDVKPDSIYSDQDATVIVYADKNSTGCDSLWQLKFNRLMAINVLKVNGVRNHGDIKANGNGNEKVQWKIKEYNGNENLQQSTKCAQCQSSCKTKNGPKRKWYQALSNAQVFLGGGGRGVGEARADVDIGNVVWPLLIVGVVIQETALRDYVMHAEGVHECWKWVCPRARWRPTGRGRALHECP